MHKILPASVLVFLLLIFHIVFSSRTLEMLHLDIIPSDNDDWMRRAITEHRADI